MVLSEEVDKLGWKRRISLTNAPNPSAIDGGNVVAWRNSISDRLAV